MRRPAGTVLRGPLIGLAAGIPIIAIAAALRGRWPLPAAVPILDTAAIVSLVVTASIAGIDARLRSDRGSLTTVALAVAAVVLWVAHLLLFPGVFAGPVSSFANSAVASIFLTLNTAMPLMLAIALLQRGGEMTNATRAVWLTVAAGLATGLALLAAAVLLTGAFTAVTAEGRFTPAEPWFGLIGLVPAVVGLTVFVSGRQGDERIGAGVAAALVLAGLNSIVLFLLTERYTPLWYADHLLALLPAVALLAGQVKLFGDLLAFERTSASRLRTSLEMAEAMAGQIDLSDLIDRLMEGAMRAVGADRATLMALEGDRLRIEASIDSSGTPAPIGATVRFEALQVGNQPIALQTMQTGRPVATGAYDAARLSPEHSASVAGVRHYLTWPLVLGGEIDAILFLARRRPEPFAERDTELLSEFATIAALLLRNARLLRSAEAASVAKGSFLNLAAHELRTPVTVVRGYLDLLVNGDLGAVPQRQREVLDTLNAKAEELASQVEHLLAASRLESGIPAAIVEDADLHTLAEQAVARAQPRAELLDATIDVIGADRAPVRTVPGDVAVILDNLLNNALTYSRPPAQVTIAVSAGVSPSIEVADEGIGIPAEEQPRVFDQFHRVDRPDFGYPGGTGLGLYISRRLAERAGGTLELVWSEVEAGSRFRLRLPSGPALAVPAREALTAS